MNKTRYDFFEHTTNARGFKAPRGFARANAAGSFDVVRHPNLGTDADGGTISSSARIQCSRPPYVGWGLSREPADLTLR